MWATLACLVMQTLSFCCLAYMKQWDAMMNLNDDLMIYETVVITYKAEHQTAKDNKMILGLHKFSLASCHAYNMTHLRSAASMTVCVQRICVC